MNADLFVYGTLMDEDTVRRVTGRIFPRARAVLPDFARFHPRGCYAYVLPRRGSEVEGLLLLEIDPASLARLDEYEDEGRLYRRIEVRVVCDGRERSCFTYCGLDPADR